MKRTFYRIIAVLMAMVMACAVMPAAMAADMSMTVQVASVTADPGDTVQVQITLANNPGIASLKFSVRYDSILTLTDVSFNSAFGSYVTAPTPYSNPQTISLISPLSEISVNGVFATLTFKVSDTAPKGYEAAISLTYDQDDVFNGDYDNVPVDMFPGSVKISGRVAGDADGDGKLNLKDVVLIRRWMAGGWNVTINENLADINGDRTVNLEDVVLLRRYLSGGWGVELM